MEQSAIQQLRNKELNFVEKMNLMRAHYESNYKSNSSTPYMISTSVIYQATAQEIPEEAKAITNKFKNSFNQLNTDEETFLKKITNEYISHKISKKYFMNLMKKTLSNSIKRAMKNINEFYYGMMEAGSKNPQSQEAILIKTAVVSDFLFHTLRKINKFVGILTKNIASFVQKATDIIQEVFNDIADSVSSFFSDLYYC